MSGLTYSHLWIEEWFLGPVFGFCNLSRTRQSSGAPRHQGIRSRTALHEILALSTVTPVTTRDRYLSPKCHEGVRYL